MLDHCPHPLSAAHRGQAFTTPGVGLLPTPPAPARPWDVMPHGGPKAPPVRTSLVATSHLYPPARRGHSPAAPSPRRPPGRSHQGAAAVAAATAASPLSPAPSPSARAGGRGALGLEAAAAGGVSGERRAAAGPGPSAGSVRVPRGARGGV